MSIAAYDFTKATITGFDYTREPIQAEGEEFHCVLERSTTDETMGSFTYLKDGSGGLPFQEGDKVKIHLKRWVVMAKDIHGGILENDVDKIQLEREVFVFEGKGEIVDIRDDMKYKEREVCTIRIRWAKADENRG